MTNSRKVVETTAIDPFQLTLPPEMQIEPKWTIELPGKHIGLIFEETITPHTKVRGPGGYQSAYADKEQPVTGWRYLVRKGNGKAVSENAGVGHWAGQFYDNLLDLKLAIEHDAQALTPKTRTRRERDEYED